MGPYLLKSPDKIFVCYSIRKPIEGELLLETLNIHKILIDFWYGHFILCNINEIPSKLNFKKLLFFSWPVSKYQRCQGLYVITYANKEYLFSINDLTAKDFEHTYSNEVLFQKTCADLDFFYNYIHEEIESTEIQESLKDPANEFFIILQMLRLATSNLSRNSIAIRESNKFIGRSTHIYQVIQKQYHLNLMIRCF